MKIVIILTALLSTLACGGNGPSVPEPVHPWGWDQISPEIAESYQRIMFPDDVEELDIEKIKIQKIDMSIDPEIINLHLERQSLEICYNILPEKCTVAEIESTMENIKKVIDNLVEQYAYLSALRERTLLAGKTR